MQTSQHSRWTRVLRTGLAAFFLVPMLTLGLVVATPGVGEAAVRFSGAQTVERRIYDTFMPGDNLDCSMGFQNRVFDGIAGTFAQWADFRGTCKRATTPTVNFDGMRMDFSFAGTTLAGASCIDYGQTTMSDDKFSGTALMALNKTVEDLCNITEICYRLHGELEVSGLPNRNVDEEECMSISLGAPATPGGGSKDCSLLTAYRPTHTNIPGASVRYGAGFRDARTVYKMSAKVPPNQLGTWRLYVVTRTAQGALKFDNTGGTTGLDTVMHPDVGFSKYWEGWGTSTSIPQPIGVGYYSATLNPGQATVTDKLPQSDPSGQIGVTDPGECSFYWGEKIALTSNDDRDEPISGFQADAPDDSGTDMGEPAAPTGGPEDPGCNFVLTDPSTWAAGGMCSAVGLLGELLKAIWSLLETIAGLASAIVGPIVDALGWLLDGIVSAIGGVVSAIANVVSAIGDLAGQLLGWIKDALLWAFDPPNDLDWGEWIDQAEARAPFSVAIDLGEAVAGIGEGYRDAGGCGVLTTFNITDANPTEVNCGSWTQTTNFDVLYGLVQAALVATTAFVMLGLVRGTVETG